MLRRHPHLQGLILGTALLAGAVVASPLAVDSIRAMGSGRAVDEDVVVVAVEPTTTSTAEEAAAPLP